MSVIAYVLAFIGIVVILAVGGMICESEVLGEKFRKAKRYLTAAAEVVLFVLMLPAVVVFRAASYMGFGKREEG